MKNFKLPSLGSLLFALVSFVLLTPVVGPEIAAGFGSVSVLCSYFPMPQNILGMNNTNNYTARESFRIAKDLLFNSMRNLFESGPNGDKKCRDWVNGRKLSQSEIRLECGLDATTNTFNFGLTANQRNNQGVIFNTENRLTMQDSLICNEYGVFVGQPSAEDAVDWQLKTYGSQPTFAAADANALNSTFYGQGYFRLTANNDVVMPYRALLNHWYRPETQQTAAFGAASPEDQIRGSEDAMITCEPNILLIGSKGYIPQIVLPKNLASAGAFSRVVLIFRGILAQNSTSVS